MAIESGSDKSKKSSSSSNLGESKMSSPRSDSSSSSYRSSTSGNSGTNLGSNISKSTSSKSSGADMGLGNVDFQNYIKQASDWVSSAYKKSPGSTLLIAGAAGFVLGKMFRIGRLPALIAGAGSVMKYKDMFGGLTSSSKSSPSNLQ